MADECFNQLKSEIKLKECHFGLFREYIEDYPEVVLRELLKPTVIIVANKSLKYVNTLLISSLKALDIFHKVLMNIIFYVKLTQETPV